MKKDMITRTITSTVITVLGLYEDTAEPTNVTVTIGGVITDKEKAMVKAKKVLAADENYKGYHPAMVVSMEKKEELLGVTLEDFIANAIPVERPASQSKEARKAKKEEKEAAF